MTFQDDNYRSYAGLPMRLFSSVGNSSGVISDMIGVIKDVRTFFDISW